jgi:hypothetical protein
MPSHSRPTTSPGRARSGRARSPRPGGRRLGSCASRRRIGKDPSLGHPKAIENILQMGQINVLAAANNIVRIPIGKPHFSKESAEGSRERAEIWPKTESQIICLVSPRMVDGISFGDACSRRIFFNNAHISGLYCMIANPDFTPLDSFNLCVCRFSQIL